MQEKQGDEPRTNVDLEHMVIFNSFFYLYVWFYFAFIRYYTRININNQFLSFKDL